MLDLIRKKQKTVLIQIVFWAIIATFVGTIFLVWGRGSDDATYRSDFAVKVNKDVIDVDQFQSAYSNIYRIYQNLYGDAFTPALEKRLDLRKMALDSLIEQTLLLQEAGKRGIKVSDKEIVEEIAKIQAFQENGVFDRNRYVQILRGQRLTPEQFEEMQRRDLLVDKARKAIEGEVTATESDIEQEYREKNEQVNLAAIRIDPTSFETRVQADAAGLQAFFAERKDDFKLPETVNLQYIVIDPKKFTAEATVTEADLERFYQRNLDRFETPEQVRAAHILVRVPQGATEEVKTEKRAAAEKLRDRALKGEDFATLAKAYSEDPGSAPRGGDLGFFGRGSMVPAFENAAFALSTGQVSGLIETSFGLHIIRLNERIEARIKPQSEVIDQVRAGATEEKSRELAQEKAMDLYNINRKEGKLAAISSALGSEIRETGFFTQANPAVGTFPVSESLATIIFAMPAGDLGRPVMLPQGVLIFALKEKRAPHTPELNEVKSAVEAAFRKVRAQTLARGEGERILTELRSGGDPAMIAAKRGLAFTQTGLFARDRNHFVPQVGSNEELSNAAFALTTATPVAAKLHEVDNAFIAVKLIERRTADPAGLTTAVKDEMTQSVLARKKQESLDKAIKALRARAELVYADAFTPPKEG